MTTSARRWTDGPAGEWTLAVFVVVVTTIVSTWPLITSPWLVPDHQDPLFSSWRLYQWTRNLLSGGAGGWFGGNMFHPTADVLLFSDAIALPALLGAPFIALGVPVTLVYWVLIWIAYLSAGLAMYACARVISGSRWGALMAAVIFTGAPLRQDHVMHLELLYTAWMPLAVLATARIFAGRGRGVWLLGTSLGAQFLCSIYFGIFLVTVWPLLAAIEWLRARPPLTRATLGRVAVAVALAGIVAGAYAVPYQRARKVVGDRDDNETSRYSATLSAYAVSPPSNLIWGWTGREDDAERRLFPGLVGTALAVTALTTPAAPWTLALAATTAVAVDASTGANGVTYPLLRRFAPPYRGLRVAARFGAVTLMGVALLAALGCARVARDLGQWRGARVAAAVLLLLAVVECSAAVDTRRLPRRAPSIYAMLAGLPPTVIVHAPLPQPDALPGAEANFLYFAQYHHHALLNGNSGFYPPSYLTLLERAHEFPDDRAIAALRGAGAEYLLLHEQYYPNREAFARVAVALEARHDLTALGTWNDDHGVVRVYRILP